MRRLKIKFPHLSEFGWNLQTLGFLLAIIALIISSYNLIFDEPIPKILEPDIQIDIIDDSFGSWGFGNAISPKEYVENISDGVSVVEIQVTNKSKDEDLTFNIEPVVNILSYSDFHTPITVYTPWEVGGGGRVIESQVILPAQSGKIITANHISSIESDFDYYSLAPGEKYITRLDIVYEWSGEYTFQIGIEYFSENGKKYYWLDTKLRAIIPGEVYLVHDEDGGQVKEACKYIGNDHEIDASGNYLCEHDLDK